MSSTNLQKGLCACGALCALIAACLIYSGVNTKVYEDKFHAPVSDVFPIFALLAVVAVKGASLQTAVAMSATALVQVPLWFGAARQIQKEEELYFFGAWATYEQSKAADEASDAGYWSHMQPGYVLLIVAFALLAAAVVAGAELDAAARRAALTSCTSSVEKLGMAGAMALLAIFFIAGEAKVNDKAGIDNPNYGEGLSATDLKFLISTLFFVALALVAVVHREVSAGWMALLGVLGSLLFAQNVGGAAEANGVLDNSGVCDSDYAAMQTYCDRGHNLVDGAALQACMAAMGVTVVFLFAFCSHGGYQPAVGASRPWLAVSAIVPLCGIIAWVGTRAIKGDDVSSVALKDEMTAMAVLLMLVGDGLMLSHIVEGGLRNALRTVCLGFGMAAVTASATLMAVPQAFTDPVTCEQGECSTSYGAVAMYLGAQLLAILHPCEVRGLATRVLASPRPTASLVLMGLGWCCLLSPASHAFQASGSYSLAVEPLYLMGWLVIAGATLVAGLSEEASRPVRCVGTFLLCYVGLTALSMADTACNDQWGQPNNAYDDDDGVGVKSARAKIAGTMLATLGCLTGVSALSAVGDWSHDLLEGTAAPPGYTAV